MNLLHIFITYVILQQFSPFLNVLTIYLVEQKGLSNKYIHQKLYLIFFITSCLFITNFYFIHIFFNVKSLVIFVSFLKIMQIICISAPKNKNSITNKQRVSKFLIHLGVFFDAISSSLFSNIDSLIFLIHSEVYGIDKDPGNTFSKIMSLKKITNIFSSLIGQALYNKSDYGPIIFLTLSCKVISLIFSLFLKPLKLSKKNLNDFFEITVYKKIFTIETVYLSIILTLTTVLDMCLIFYSSNIFIERKQKLSNFLMKIVKSLSYFLDFFINIYLKIYNIFYTTTVKSKSIEEDILLFGYVDALSKIVSIFFSLIYSKFTLYCFFENNQISISGKIYLNLTIFLLLICLYKFTSTQSIEKTYALRIFLSSLISGINFTVYPLLSKKMGELKTLLFILLHFSSSLIHLIVSICSMKKNTVTFKLRLCLNISLFLFGLTIILMIL